MKWPFSKPKNEAVSRFGSWIDWFSSPVTSSGMVVTNQNSLTLSTVFACIRNISEDIAKVPLKVYKKTGDDKEVVADHPISMLLNRAPNPDMTAMDFRQTMTANMLGWGNAYAEIERNLGGQITGLFPLLPEKVKPRRLENGQIIYEVTDEDGKPTNIPADRILHIRGFSPDGIVGYNVIEYARESLGAIKAAEKFGATYFGNNTVLGGILKHPTTLTDKSRDNLRRSLEKYRGAENANKILLLEEAMEWIHPVIPPEASQFLETRQFSIPEICRWFRMPPHKVHDLTRATFSNIEHQDLEYVKDCLTAWFKRWEESIWHKLLSDKEKRAGYYAEHTVEGLLKGDIQSRYASYQIALGNNNNPGFMTINEVRKLENLNSMDGGDELFSPQQEDESMETQNMEPIDEEMQSDNKRDN